MKIILSLIDTKNDCRDFCHEYVAHMNWFPTGSEKRSGRHTVA